MRRVPPAEAVTVRAPAKINLCLHVGPPRPDGFHPLATVYQAIGLYDDVTATPAEEWSVRTIPDAELERQGFDPATVPDDDTNLAVRAGRALVAHHGADLAAHLEIHKGIPVAGGLAGGSADAAAALVALDRLWNLQTSDDDLLAIAADLGSDVPFALLGGTASGTGRGELVEPVANAVNAWWVVVPSDVGLSTPSVYRQYDVLAEHGEILTHDPTVPAGLLRALKSGSFEVLESVLITSQANDLTAAAYSLRPDLAERDELLREIAGEAVLLSGSGPTQLVLCRTTGEARAASRALTERDIPHWLAPGPVAGCHVVSYRQPPG
jgi:4-diphosphocytidyl-2C-methyl-D-erythritol kinase